MEFATKRKGNNKQPTVQRAKRIGISRKLQMKLKEPDVKGKSPRTTQTKGELEKEKGQRLKVQKLKKA